MSVIRFSVQDFQQLLAQYSRLHRALPATAPAPHDLQLALVGAYYANTAAYCATYDDAVHDVTIAPIHEHLAGVAPAPTPMPYLTYAWARQLVRELRSLQYNCVANNGANYLPSLYDNVLQHAINEVLDRLAGMDTDDDALLAAA